MIRKNKYVVKYKGKTEIWEGKTENDVILLASNLHHSFRVAWEMNKVTINKIEEGCDE